MKEIPVHKWCDHVYNNKKCIKCNACKPKSNFNNICFRRSLNR
jgi:hypothetical protein